MQAGRPALRSSETGLASQRSVGREADDTPGHLRSRLVDSQSFPHLRREFGFREGLVQERDFRLILLSSTVALLHKVVGLGRWLAVALAFLATAVLFSAAHHVIGGEPWRVGVFTYRVLCGLIFAVIFQTRGFAVAVYTHAMYDVFVLVV